MIVQQRARCDCGVAATAMYCGVGYMVVWEALEPRERVLFRQGQGMFWRTEARIVEQLTGHRLLYHEIDKEGRAPLEAPAILTVTSRTLTEEAGREVHHVVYWDGVQCFDPTPGRESAYVRWPKPGELHGMNVALQFHEDFKDHKFDWPAYYGNSFEMNPEGALGIEYAEGLPE